MRRLIKKAEQWISSEDYTNGEKYYPTDQDIKDTLQEPFDKLIKPIEKEIKEYLQKEIRTIISSSARHFIHKNRNIDNDSLYDFVLKHINFSKLFSELKYNFEFEYDYFDHIISYRQLEFEFTNYVKKYFALYMRLLIEKYKKEVILNIKEQNEDKNYNTDPYIRTPEQLDLLIDNIGDYIQLDQSFNINYKCRDSAFIFVKNKAYTGKSHIDLMQDYLSTHGIDDPYYFNIENIDKLKLPYSYGHIYRGKALINWHKYCTVDEVKNALLKEGKYIVYDYNTKEQILHRLAKKILYK